MRQTILKYTTLLIALAALAGAVLFAQKKRKEKKTDESIEIMETSKSGLPRSRPKFKPSPDQKNPDSGEEQPAASNDQKPKKPKKIMPSSKSPQVD